MGLVPTTETKLWDSNSMSMSHVAELECQGKNLFQIYASTEFVDMSNPLRPNINTEAMKGFSVLSATYITVSLIAEKRGHKDLVLHKGDRIGLGELKDSSHPLHKLFPDYANRKIPRQ